MIKAVLFNWHGQLSESGNFVISGRLRDSVAGLADAGKVITTSYITHMGIRGGILYCNTHNSVYLLETVW